MNIIIISARRSGTHLATDMIVNNFGLTRLDNSIDFDFLSKYNVETFISEMKKGNKLAWSHAHNYDSMFNKDLDDIHIQELKKIFCSSKIVYVYRDIRDTIVSSYYRQYNTSKYNTFDDYYANTDMKDYTYIVNNFKTYSELSDVIIEQHKNWFSVYFAKELLGLDIKLLSYEDIIQHYSNVINELSAFFDVKSVVPYKDVRLHRIKDEKEEIIYTHNDFRRGKIGDWKYDMNINVANSIHERYNNEVSYHTNAYIKNEKLHEHHIPERNKFQISSKDWNSIELELDENLIQYSNYFNDFVKNNNVDEIVLNRYEESIRKIDDIRYMHKVFLYDNYVLKFLYPCKADLELNTFEYVTSIASKENLLTILKSDQILSSLHITPKLYYAGIHLGVLTVIQERVLDEDLVYKKYNVTHPDLIINRWMTSSKLYPLIFEQFFKALNKNILLSDYFSSYNLSECNNTIQYLDLDGIKVFNTQDELLNSKEYFNCINTFKLMDNMWIEDGNDSVLNMYIKV